MPPLTRQDIEPPQDDETDAACKHRLFVCVDHPSAPNFAASTIVLASSPESASHFVLQTFTDADEQCDAVHTVREVNTRLPAAYWLHANEFFVNFDSHTALRQVTPYHANDARTLSVFTARNDSIDPIGLSMLIVAENNAQARLLFEAHLARTIDGRGVHIDTISHENKARDFFLQQISLHIARSAPGVYELARAKMPYVVKK
jgi:hypothetical protein